MILFDSGLEMCVCVCASCIIRDKDEKYYETICASHRLKFAFIHSFMPNFSFLHCKYLTHSSCSQEKIKIVLFIPTHTGKHNPLREYWRMHCISDDAPLNSFSRSLRNNDFRSVCVCMSVWLWLCILFVIAFFSIFSPFDVCIFLSFAHSLAFPCFFVYFLFSFSPLFSVSSVVRLQLVLYFIGWDGRWWQETVHCSLQREVYLLSLPIVDCLVWLLYNSLRLTMEQHPKKRRRRIIQMCNILPESDSLVHPKPLFLTLLPPVVHPPLRFHWANLSYGVRHIRHQINVPGEEWIESEIRDGGDADGEGTMASCATTENNEYEYLYGVNSWCAR